MVNTTRAVSHTLKLGRLKKAPEKNSQVYKLEEKLKYFFKLHDQ